MTATAAATTTVSNPLNTYIQQQQATQAAATAAATAASSDPTSASAIAGNFNTFINILTTQLKNQDPTSATDPNQFTEELVQFSQVEQQLNTNSDLNKIYNLQSASSLATGVGYVGNYVESSTTNNQFSLQNGSAEFGYTLSAAAANVNITVTNSNNNVVGSFSGTGTAGVNNISWNGQNGSGTQYPDGTYTFAVTATDSAGNAVNVTSPVIFSKVSGVTSNSDGTLSLASGGLTVSSANITGIYTAATLPTASALVSTTSSNAGS